MERTQDERYLRDCHVPESNDWRTIAGDLRDIQTRNKYSRETMMVQNANQQRAAGRQMWNDVCEWRKLVMGGGSVFSRRKE